MASGRAPALYQWRASDALAGTWPGLSPRYSIQDCLCPPVGVCLCRGLMRATLHLVNREFEALADDFVTLGMLPKTEVGAGGRLCAYSQGARGMCLRILSRACCAVVHCRSLR